MPPIPGLDSNVLTGGAAVAGVWALRELLSFILKWRKQEHEMTYKPEQEWKKYVCSKFDQLTTKLSEVTAEQKVLRTLFERLERSVK